MGYHFIEHLDNLYIWHPFSLLAASGNVDENIDPTNAEIIDELLLQAFTFEFPFVSTL